MIFIVHIAILMLTAFSIQVFSLDSVSHVTSKGIFKTLEELDTYEKLWHSNVYEPSCVDLNTKVQ